MSSLGTGISWVIKNLVFRSMTLSISIRIMEGSKLRVDISMDKPRSLGIMNYITGK